MEIYKDIKGYEGFYQVSNFGNVRSLKRSGYQHGNSKQTFKGRVLKQYLGEKGYYSITLSKDNKQKKIQVHRLVAMTFIDNPYKKPQINHIDGIKTNNKAENLEWCTGSENMKHAFKIGLQSLSGEKNTMAKLTNNEVVLIRKCLKTGLFTQKEIANIFGVARRTITDINLNKTWITSCQ